MSIGTSAKRDRRSTRRGRRMRAWRTRRRCGRSRRSRSAARSKPSSSASCCRIPGPAPRARSPDRVAVELARDRGLERRLPAVPCRPPVSSPVLGLEERVHRLRHPAAIKASRAASMRASRGRRRAAPAARRSSASAGRCGTAARRGRRQVDSAELGHSPRNSSSMLRIPATSPAPRDSRRARSRSPAPARRRAPRCRVAQQPRPGVERAGHARPAAVPGTNSSPRSGRRERAATVAGPGPRRARSSLPPRIRNGGTSPPGPLRCGSTTCRMNGRSPPRRTRCRRARAPHPPPTPASASTPRPKRALYLRAGGERPSTLAHQVQAPAPTTRLGVDRVVLVELGEVAGLAEALDARGRRRRGRRACADGRRAA